MKEIVALCKRRGFIFPASDIYGGINGFWDYGPLGVELKNNLRDLWWKWMVTCPPIGPDGQPVEIVGVDSAIIQNPKAWEASGHVGGFSDPMVDCRETKLRYRADHLIAYLPSTFDPKDDSNLIPVFMQGTPDDEIEKKFKKIGFHFAISQCETVPFVELEKYGYVEDYGLLLLRKDSSAKHKILKERTVGPDTKTVGTLTEPKQFNLMFHTFIGATGGDENKAYLRPETAQGIFLNFKNVLDSTRVRVPFGIAQIGKAFRTEVNPRNFIFRSREFEQMEMEWFCHPDEAKLWRDFWFAERQKFWRAIGLRSDNLRMRDHDQDELSHYAKAGLGTADIEYRFPFTAPDFGELEGIAHRCDFDLTQHQKHSGVKLEYMDPVTQEKFMPHVIEPAAGLTRGVLAMITEAYTPDPSRPSGVYLDLHPALAPKKAAILPLTAKDQHPVIATKLYMELRGEFAVDLDIKQNIGKRYARQDEIGTPYCFTIDDQTVADQTVTVRERNTMKQERIAIANVAEYLRKNIRAV
ncbi:MAG: glycine--tRNA ligase [Micavibrio aeruginosavorus]|nr:glycine--tRNA ligase [Micavibrio aeruginosavorus]